MWMGDAEKEENGIRSRVMKGKGDIFQWCGDWWCCCWCYRCHCYCLDKTNLQMTMQKQKMTMISLHLLLFPLSASWCSPATASSLSRSASPPAPQLPQSGAAAHSAHQPLFPCSYPPCSVLVSGRELSQALAGCQWDPAAQIDARWQSQWRGGCRWDEGAGGRQAAGGEEWSGQRRKIARKRMTLMALLVWGLFCFLILSCLIES